MSITAMADRRITVHRRTSLLLDPTPVGALLVPSRQPGREACVRVVVAGGAAPGQVTVSGLVGGAPGAEVVQLLATDKRSTRSLFSQVDTLAFVGLAGATVEVSAVGRDGSRVHADAGVVVAGWPMRMDRAATSWPNPVQGGEQVENATFYLDYTTVWEPREGDVFVDDRTGDSFFVLGKPTLHGGGLVVPHHYEIRVQRREGSLGT